MGIFMAFSLVNLVDRRSTVKGRPAGAAPWFSIAILA